LRSEPMVPTYDVRNPIAAHVASAVVT